MLESDGNSITASLFDTTISSNTSSLTSSSPPPSNNTWLFGSQSLYSSLSSALTHQVDSASLLADQTFSLSNATVDSLPLSISQLTGAPLKQMPHPHAARFAGGAAVNVATAGRRSAYAVVPQAGLGAPGSPIGSSVTAASPPLSTAAAPPPKNPKLYKTELCRTWMDQGRCNYGERCQYAHGEHEKRSVPRHPKYKTEMCQSFHKSGYCPYGHRCHFIHSESEMIGNNGQSLAATSPLQAAAMNTHIGAAMPLAPPTQLRGRALAPGSQLFSNMHNGFGSTEVSPAGSSADSGSESPHDSFSPGLDLDETSPLAAVFGISQRMKTTGQGIGGLNSRFGPGTGGFSSAFPNSEKSLSGLLDGISAWKFDDKFSEEGSNGRLPVFAQLSNPPQ